VTAAGAPASELRTGFENRQVRPDQAVCRIYNVFGKLQETLCAQRTGVVLGHADSSVALPGMPLVAFGNV
jgi:predicted deacylase